LGRLELGGLLKVRVDVSRNLRLVILVDFLDFSLGSKQRVNKALLLIAGGGNRSLRLS